uniref:Hepatocyte growth factor-regulated tyrosine kinase substrate helical domain-containing protein n=1 Tax=Timema shepardi TaxID=629360 RepID=A0A7R9AWL6_TIMSH|nr:unnamed protein product [Timema shepardi]
MRVRGVLRFCQQVSSVTESLDESEKEACYNSVNNVSSVTESLHESEREACYDSVNKSTTTPGPTTATAFKGEGDLPPEYVSSSLAQQNQQLVSPLAACLTPGSLSHPWQLVSPPAACQVVRATLASSWWLFQAPPRKTEEELREEEEFQLALALSQSEAEHKEKEVSDTEPGVSVLEEWLPVRPKKRTATMMSSAAASRAKQYSPPPHTENTPSHEEEVDPELARYLNRSLWNQRKATAEEKETGADRDKSASPLSQPSAPQKQENGESDGEIEEFVAALKGQVEIFVNRMKSNSSRGRCIANDSSVQTLFMNITAMHSRLLRYIQQQDDNRVYYEGLQDKLTQVKDARAALDALREEHREKLRRQAEEAERIRQMQMAHKLEIMRKKKQDYLQYQRQLALQRIQEQERERQMRQEQQKQQYLMGTMPSYPMHYLPSVQQQGYTPGTVEGPPVHGQFGPGHMVPGNPYAAANIPGTQMGAYPHYPEFLARVHLQAPTPCRVHPVLCIT